MGQPARPVPLERLDRLVGEWEMVFTGGGSDAFPSPIGGRTRFDWLSGGQFLIQRWEADGALYTQHYFDSRGVVRIVAMSFEDGIWKLWRDSPGSHSASSARSAMTARPSEDAGRSPQTAPVGSATSTSYTGRSTNRKER
jgi:hypothetical protein